MNINLQQVSFGTRFALQNEGAGLIKTLEDAQLFDKVATEAKVDDHPERCISVRKGDVNSYHPGLYGIISGEQNKFLGTAFPGKGNKPAPMSNRSIAEQIISIYNNVDLAIKHKKRIENAEKRQAKIETSVSPEEKAKIDEILVRHSPRTWSREQFEKASKQ